jgi:putative phosphoserine phosphatase/1-acylglycerol-3-phosphate O-acyltransferase
MHPGKARNGVNIATCHRPVTTKVHYSRWQDYCNLNREPVVNTSRAWSAGGHIMTSLDIHLRSVAAAGGAPAVAFFDLDRTLIAGYSILALATETAQLGARRGRLRQSAKVIRDLLKHKVDSSGSNYHRVVRRTSRALSGISESALTRLGEQAYRKHLAKNLYREAIALVEAHRAAGHKLVIVSAASRYQIEPIARVLGIEEICCTRLEVVDGRFTGHVIAPLCYGEGKLLAARRSARKHRAALKHCWFYSDSSADLPLLRKVGNPVAVNPSDKLGAHARAANWPQLHFSTRGMPSLEQIARTALTLQTVLATSGIGLLSKRLGLDTYRNANQLTRLLGDVGSAFAGLDFEIDGADNLRRERPAIFVFNHQSLLDAMVLAHLLREDVVALCKQEMANNPVVGPLLRQADTIFVDRGENDQAAVLRRAMSVLASGRSLVIAPEGTRSTLGDIQPFKHGAFFLARKAGVPIVPIVLHNVKDALPKGGLLVRPATVRVTVLEPIAPDSIRSVRRACSELEERYIELLDRSAVAALPYDASAIA